MLLTLSRGFTQAQTNFTFTFTNSVGRVFTNAEFAGRTEAIAYIRVGASVYNARIRDLPREAWSNLPPIAVTQQERIPHPPIPPRPAAPPPITPALKPLDDDGALFAQKVAGRTIDKGTYAWKHSYLIEITNGSPQGRRITAVIQMLDEDGFAVSEQRVTGLFIPALATKELTGGILTLLPAAEKIKTVALKLEGSLVHVDPPNP